jgi:hypothetical protein
VKNLSSEKIVLPRALPLTYPESALCCRCMHDLTLPAVAARRRPILREDTTVPITVEMHDVQEETRAENRAVMGVSETLGRRVRVRIQPEIWVKWGGKRWNYRRARQCGIAVSCPNPEQAELFIQAMHDFAASLTGKWLAPSPTSRSSPPGL